MKKNATTRTCSNCRRGKLFRRGFYNAKRGWWYKKHVVCVKRYYRFKPFINSFFTQYIHKYGEKRKSENEVISALRQRKKEHLCRPTFLFSIILLHASFLSIFLWVSLSVYNSFPCVGFSPCMASFHAKLLLICYLLPCALFFMRNKFPVWIWSPSGMVQRRVVSGGGWPVAECGLLAAGLGDYDRLA